MWYHLACQVNHNSHNEDNFSSTPTARSTSRKPKQLINPHSRITDPLNLRNETKALPLPLNLPLNPALQLLTPIMLRLKSPLTLPIAHRARHGRTHTPDGPVAHAVTQIAQLGLRLLRLTLAVLVLAGAFQVGGPDEVAEGLFAGADGLVVVACCAAGGGAGGVVGGVGAVG